MQIFSGMKNMLYYTNVPEKGRIKLILTKFFSPFWRRQPFF